MMFSPKRLRRYLLIEMTRVGRALGESVVADYASGSFVRDVEDRTGKIPAGGDLLARDLAMLKADLRDILAKVSSARRPNPGGWRRGDRWRTSRALGRRTAYPRR